MNDHMTTPTPSTPNELAAKVAEKIRKKTFDEGWLSKPDLTALIAAELGPVFTELTVMQNSFDGANRIIADLIAAVTDERDRLKSKLRPACKHEDVEITSADSSGITGICKDCGAHLNGSAPGV